MFLPMPIRRRLRPVRALAFVLLLHPAHAEEKVLFLGNSFTFGDGGTTGVPRIFDRLAVAGGHEDPTTEMRAVGGTSFQFHENDETSRAAIASRPWTYVVLQNYSTEPTHIGNAANHLKYGGLLHERVIANHPATRVILYQTWARSAAHPLISGKPGEGAFASTAQMQAELREGYRKLATLLDTNHAAGAPVLIAPVGDAWENAGGLLPESDPGFVSLHGGDHYHGNDNGYFLSAAVFYATIYGRSPEGLHAAPEVASLGLRLTVDAALLERTAWQTVTGAAAVSFTAQPGSRTVMEHQPASFAATVRGSAPHVVQWFRNGEAIGGANELTYTIAGAGRELDGSVFTVKVSNAVSTATSEAAKLSVTADEKEAAPPGGTS